MHQNYTNFSQTKKVIYIGKTKLNTKIETRQFIGKHRESGFLSPEDAAAFHAFFKLKIQYASTTTQP